MSPFQAQPKHLIRRFEEEAAPAEELKPMSRSLIRRYDGQTGPAPQAGILSAGNQMRLNQAAANTPNAHSAPSQGIFGVDVGEEEDSPFKMLRRVVAGWGQ